MAIDFTVDLVKATFASNVASDAAYQIPGTFHLPANFGKLTLGSSAIAAGGATTYVVGNTLTLVGGTSTTAATVRVSAASAGVVTAVTVLNPGVYTVQPANPVVTSGGAGTGCTLTAVWNGYAAERLLTVVEVIRSYLAEMDNVHELKLLQTIMARIMAEMSFGTTYNTTKIAANAQAAALKYLAANGKGLVNI
jgi:hypothetical protein